MRVLAGRVTTLCLLFMGGDTAVESAVIIKVE